MAVVQLPLIPGSLPVGACYGSEQARLNAFMAASYAQLNGMAFYNYGPDTPAVEFQSYPWLNTNTGLLYFYSNSLWITPRPLIEQDPSYRILWIGAEADVPTIMGGTAGVATAYTGPFWEIDHDFDGRSPMGPGAIPTANPAKTLAVEEDYGEGAHTMTELELAPHDHPPRTGFGAYAGFVEPGQSSSYEITGGSEIERMGSTGEAGGEEDADDNLVAQPMPVIHPVKGIWVLKPTARIWITV